MTGRITHRRGLERLTFDHEGLEVHTWLGGSLRLPWAAVDFVCLTPTQERTTDGWRATRHDLPGAAQTLAYLEGLGLLTLGFVVKDRRPHLGALPGAWRRLYWGARLRPMVGADDRPKVDQALLHLELKLGRLDAPKDALLDLLAAHCRFDLVVYDA